MKNISSNFLSFFKGFVDGKGYIKIIKTPKGYIRLRHSNKFRYI